MPFCWFCHEVAQIYFIECVDNIRFSRVRSTSEIDDIFNIRDEIFLVFTEFFFSFYFILFRTITESRPL